MTAAGESGENNRSKNFCSPHQHHRVRALSAVRVLVIAECRNDDAQNNPLLCTPPMGVLDPSVQTNTRLSPSSLGCVTSMPRGRGGRGRERGGGRVADLPSPPAPCCSTHSGSREQKRPHLGQKCSISCGGVDERLVHLRFPPPLPLACPLEVQ